MKKEMLLLTNITVALNITWLSVFGNHSAVLPMLDADARFDSKKKIFKASSKRHKEMSKNSQVRVQHCLRCYYSSAVYCWSLDLSAPCFTKATPP